jgi:hypothetical protein
MLKSEAIKIFGTTAVDLGNAVGLTKARISQWGDVLTQKQTDLVIGAAVRLGRHIPESFLPNSSGTNQ